MEFDLISSKLLSLASNALISTLNPWLKAFLESFFWNSIQLLCQCLNVRNGVKTFSFKDGFNCWEESEVAGALSWWRMKLFFVHRFKVRPSKILRLQLFPLERTNIAVCPALTIEKKNGPNFIWFWLTCLFRARILTYFLLGTLNRPNFQLQLKFWTWSLDLNEVDSLTPCKLRHHFPSVNHSIVYVYDADTARWHIFCKSFRCLRRS